MKKVGVISLQGAISEHKDILQRSFSSLGIKGEAVLIRTEEQLEEVYGVIIPGGESTTISRLISDFRFRDTILRRAEEEDMPVMGTCAGMIILAKHGDESVLGKQVEPLFLMDMKVDRNAFGSQRESFQAPLDIEGFDEPYPGVFIRAPVIKEVKGACKVLSRLEDGTRVMARERNRLGLSFHPELTDDTRVHEMFLEL